MVMPRIKVPLLVALLTLATAIGYDVRHLADEQRFNAELTEGDHTPASGSADSRRQFADAYALQQARDFKQAVKAYASISAPQGSQLQLNIKYNLANLYFREAVLMRDNGADDLAMPLLELAKQNYKEILRIDADHWNAKYNLELALFLAPETDPVDTLAERNPEHSNRALTKLESRKNLP